MAWLNTHSESSAGKKFLKLSGDQQNSLFEPLGFKRKARPGEEDGRRFFALVREYTHSKHVCAEVLIASGELEESGDAPEIPGFSLHETGTCRMGNDPKKFVTNRFGQAHDVSNLYVCDASVFLNCTNKTTTIRILAFTIRSSEHLIEKSCRGERQSS